MVDIDRRSGAVIDNLASALQSVEIIMTTRIGELITLREFGSGAVELLGRLVTPALFATYQQLVATAIDLWEPRFHVRRVLPFGAVDDIRAGRVGIRFEADFRPLGHLGDFSVERVVNFSLFFRNGGAVAQAA